MWASSSLFQKKFFFLILLFMDEYKTNWDATISCYTSILPGFKLYQHLSKKLPWFRPICVQRGTADSYRRSLSVTTRDRNKCWFQNNNGVPDLLA